MVEDIAALVALCHHRWCLPLLAEMGARARGARLVEVQSALRAPRPGVQRAAASLMELGLLDRFPGYGHPLRPEYVLTPAGRAVAARSAAYVNSASALNAHAVAFRKWTAPVLVAVLAGASRFTALNARLDGITPRALTSALRASCGAGLLRRRVDDGFPPRSQYGLSANGTRLAEHARTVCRALESGDRIQPSDGR